MLGERELSKKVATEFKVKMVHNSELKCYFVLDEDYVIIGWMTEDVVIEEWIVEDDVAIGLVNEDDINEIDIHTLEKKHCDASIKLGFEYVVIE